MAVDSVSLTLSVAGLSPFPVVLEVHSVATVLQSVLGYVLILESISSLRCYTCHFIVLADQVNLQPLVSITCGG